MRIGKLNVSSFVIVLLLTCTYTCRAGDGTQPDIKALRKKLVLAINSKNTTDSLYTNLNSLKKKPPLITAYIGALDALKAKHSWNPYSKIKDLNLSQSLLQRAVADDPHNIEIRFMRFSIQQNVPGFLGYGKNLVGDKEEMIGQISRKNYGTADKELTHTIVVFLLDSKKCSATESTILHGYLNDNK